MSADDNTSSGAGQTPNEPHLKPFDRESGKFPPISPETYDQVNARLEARRAEQDAIFALIDQHQTDREARVAAHRRRLHVTAYKIGQRVRDHVLHRDDALTQIRQLADAEDPEFPIPRAMLPRDEAWQIVAYAYAEGVVSER